MKWIWISFIFYCTISNGQSVETASRTWEISTSFSYGSENSIGNPGFMLTSEYERFVSSSISVSGRIGFFYSVGGYNFDDDFLSFGCLSAGLYLSHISRFNEGRSYVRLSGGLSYFHSTSHITYEAVTGTFETITEVLSKPGYGLSLEGGKFISERFGLGGYLQIYSYQIFGDITVLGVNARFRIN
jgi:hypothetical protein